MEEIIHIPPLPPLRRNSGWTGEVRLSSWVPFLGKEDTYCLEVSAREGAPPTPEQVAAFRHLLDNEASITESIARAILEYYPEARSGCIDAYDGDSACIAEMEAILPENLTDVPQLYPLVGLAIVHILPVARNGLAYVGFQLGCVWDEEHGAGVLTHDGRVVLTGQADVSFAAWAARKDAATTE